MNIGYLVTLLASVAILISTIGFYLAARGKSRFLNLAVTSYHYFFGFVIVASALLFYLFIAGKYSYRYVFEYSSSDLTLFYRISGFWAGQRGTYLLWLLLQSLFGYYIIGRGRQYTAPAMVFYGLINIFFCVMLLKLSPFEMLPTAQVQGAGLNPLLKDPWMVIHPPVIFIGYAAVAVPAVIALAALVRKDYESWLTVSYVPAILGAVALAAGNIMGGFWAYKTLGWGGYWAWDPVENSSFIPWMTSMALIHGLLIERGKGSLRKTNLFLAIFTFLLVVYGTFLTRSGVLANFSVHSFVDLGVNAYLIIFMVGFVVLSLGIFASRFLGIKGPVIDLAVTSRELVLLISVWILTLIALLVLSGTSWPLITTLFGKPGTIDTAVYTRVTFPLTIIIGLFLGFAPFTLRSGRSYGTLFKKVLPSIIAAAVVTGVAYLFGVKLIGYLFFIFFVTLATVSNGIALVGNLPGRFWRAGAQISHFGLGLMLLGILSSSAYGSHEEVVIPKGGNASAFGMDVSYEGMASAITTPDNEIILDVTEGGTQFQERPKLFWAQRMEALMRRPAIHRHILYDYYFAPENIQEATHPEGIELTKGDSIEMGGYAIKFVDFEQGSHETGSPMKFGAILHVTDSLGDTATVTPAMVFGTDQTLQHEDTPLMPGLDSMVVRLDKIMADQGAVRLSIEGLQPEGRPEQLVLEVSKKPGMNVLWGGSIILVLGGLVSLIRRWSSPASSA